MMSGGSILFISLSTDMSARSDMSARTECFVRPLFLSPDHALDWSSKPYS